MGSPNSSSDSVCPLGPGTPGPSSQPPCSLPARASSPACEGSRGGGGHTAPCPQRRPLPGLAQGPREATVPTSCFLSLPREGRGSRLPGRPRGARASPVPTPDGRAPAPPRDEVQCGRCRVPVRCAVAAILLPEACPERTLLVPLIAFTFDRLACDRPLTPARAPASAAPLRRASVGGAGGSRRCARRSPACPPRDGDGGDVGWPAGAKEEWTATSPDGNFSPCAAPSLHLLPPNDPDRFRQRPRPALESRCRTRSNCAPAVLPAWGPVC